MGKEIKLSLFIQHNTIHILVQSPSPVQLFMTLWTVACQTSLSFTISWSLPKFMSIESVMLSTHLILCCLILLLPSIFQSISVFSNESTLHIKWLKYWSVSFSISSSNEYSRFISFKIGLISLLSKGLSRVFYNTTVQKHQFLGVLPSLWSSSHLYMITRKTIALTIQTIVGKVMSLIFNTV